MQTVNFSSLEEQYIGGNIYQFWRLRVWYLWSFITYKEILVIGKAKSWVSDIQVWSLYRLLSFRNQCHWIMVLSVYYCNSKQWWVASSVKYQSDLSKFYLIYVFVFSCDYLNFHTWWVTVTVVRTCGQSDGILKLNFVLVWSKLCILNPFHKPCSLRWC